MVRHSRAGRQLPRRTAQRHPPRRSVRHRHRPPESTARAQRSVTWYDLACRFTDMKWPHLAAKSRMSIADALATITPALVTTTRGMPDPQTLRAALYGWAFNKEQRASQRPSPEHAAAIGWIQRELPEGSRTGREGPPFRSSSAVLSTPSP